MADFGLASWLGLGGGRPAAAQQASRPAGGEQQQQDGAAASDAAAAATPLQPRTSVKASSVLTTPASAPKVAASDALAAAIARGNSAMAPKVEPKGTALPPGDAVFDVDAVPEASVQQLRVTTVTKLKSDWREKSSQYQIASNASYIAYGLRQGHIRLLSKETASPALLKGHTAMVTDMQFCPASNLLASCDASGAVHVRSITESDGQLQDELLFSKGFGANEAASRRLSWHPELENLLAVASADRVSFVNVPPTIGVATFPEFSQPVSPPGPQTQGTLTCVAFSHKGDLLAACDDQGLVHVWLLPPDFSTRPKYEALPCAPDLSFRAFGDGAAASSVPSVLDFLPSAAGSTQVLVVGDQACALLALWHLAPPAAAAAAARLEARRTSTLRVHSGAGGGGGASRGGVLNHLVVLRSLSAVVLANQLKQQVYVLHVHQGSSGAGASSGGGAGGASSESASFFDYVSTFAVMMPVLSLAASAEGVVQDPSGADTLGVYTVQTEAVQEYTLYPSACFPATDLEEDSVRQQLVYAEAHTPAPPASIHPVIPPTLHMPQLASPPAAAAAQAAATPAPPPAQQQQQEDKASPPAPPPPPVLPASLLHAASRELPTPPRVSAASPTTEPAAAPTPQAHALTPTKGDSAEEDEEEEAEHRTPLPNVSQMAFRRQGSAASLDSDATSPAPGAQPPPKPPPTAAQPPRAADPEEHSSLTVLAARAAATPPAAAATVHASAPQEDDGAESEGSTGAVTSKRRAAPEAPAAAAATPALAAPPATQEEETPAEAEGGSGAASEDAGDPRAKRVRRKSKAREGSGNGAAAAAPLAAAAPAAAAAAASPAPPLPPAPSLSLLSRGGAKGSAGPAHAAPAAADGAAAAEQAVPEQAAAAATAAAAAAAGRAIAAGPSSGVATQSAPAVDTQALLAQVTSQHKELLRQVKQELKQEVRAGLKAQEAALRQQAAAQQEELARAAERAVREVVGQELGARLAEMQRALATQVATAARAAVAEVLPTTTQQAADKAVRATLPRAVADALRESFVSTLVPSFERATQVMFGQIEQALSSGLGAQLKASQDAAQAVRGASSEITQACGALRSEVANLTGVSTTLASRASSTALPGTSLGADVPLPAPLARDPRIAMKEHLARKEFDAAFSVALSSNGAEHLPWLLHQVVPTTVLGVPCLLSQGVILSLLSHLGVGLDSEPEAKLHWITEAGNSLDVNDPHAARHARMVLDPLKQRLGQLAVSHGGEVGRLAKTAVHVINSLLHMMAEVARG